MPLAPRKRKLQHLFFFFQEDVTSAFGTVCVLGRAKHEQILFTLRGLYRASLIWLAPLLLGTHSECQSTRLCACLPARPAVIHPENVWTGNFL